MPAPFRLLIFTLGAAIASPALAQEVPAPAPEAKTGVSSYPPDFFAGSQPATALDMVKLLPGFRLQEGNVELRGYSGATANLLIDGHRPASKQETVEELLKRIPAQSVARIDLIRGGQGGYDMQGYALIANVVRAGGAAVRGRVEAEYADYRHGFTAPRLAGEIAYGDDRRRIELSGAWYRGIEDDHGFGTRHRYAPDGSVLRLARFDEPEGETVKQLSAAYRQPLFGGELRVNGLWKDSRAFADITNLIRFPETIDIFGTERGHERATEGGLNYQRKLGRAALELVAIRRDTRARAVDRSIEGAEEELNTEASDASETILRAVLRTTLGSIGIETGMEGARNILDSRVALLENGVDVPLPAARVRVAEDRAEGFVTLSGRPAGHLAIEAGLRGEVSRIVQSGDSQMAKSLAFLKPRLLATWSPPGSSELRLLVERAVGQLDFADFVSSASLSNGTVTAGNKDLEPDSLWRIELAWERRLGKGSLVLTARREMIGNVVDRIPVIVDGVAFDAVGNIGSGVRHELQADLTLPMDWMGLSGVTVQAELTARRSRVTDPTTGRRRVISGDVPLEGTISFAHDLPRWNVRWGANYAIAAHETQFKIDEVQRDRLGGRLDAFVEYKPDTRWTMRLFAKNLTDSAALRDRTVYAGLRDQGVPRFLERRVLRSGPYVGLTVQRNFTR